MCDGMVGVYKGGWISFYFLLSGKGGRAPVARDDDESFRRRGV